MSQMIFDDSNAAPFEIGSKCGVYMINNNKTGNFYIGSSSNIRLRYASHKNALVRGRHQSGLMQKEYDELYDKSLISFDVIAYCDKETRLEREKICIKELSPPYNGEIGRPPSPMSNETVRPWEAEGISRNTWYVRQRVRRAMERAAAEERNKMASKPSVKPPAEDDTW